MKNDNKTSGMTLIELVVVMGLLAALATYALTSIDGLSDRTRVDTTIHRMEQLRSAMVGDDLQASRFVSDMGRLPRVYSSEPGEEFLELLSDEGGFEVYTNEYSYTPLIDGVSFDSVAFSPGFGWKGPYISTEYEKIFDGFGNRFQVQTTDNHFWHDAADSDGGITAIRSLGRDNQEGEGLDWADADVLMTDFSDMAECSLTIQIYVVNRSVVESPVWGGPVIITPLGSGIAARTYTYGEIFINDSGVFRCISNVSLGMPAASPVIWNVEYPGAKTVVSNSTTALSWEYMGKNHQYMSEVKAVLFEPDTSGSTTGVKEHIQILSEGESSVKFENITPGTRKFMVFGALINGSSAANAYSSGLRTVELRYGENFEHVYLTIGL